MKKFLIAILCGFTIWSAAMAADDEKSFSYESMMGQIGAPGDATTPSPEQPSRGNLIMLMADSGKNLSEMNVTLYSAVADFGAAGLKIGEVVRFSAPSPEWVLKSVQIMGWSGFNNTTGRFPPERNFLIEVRDLNGELLYKFADAQNFYFASTSGPVLYKMDTPPIRVTKDFYVVFYDRGSMFLGAEMGNGTGNSYFIINGQLVPAETRIVGTNETAKVNWLIRAVGE
jgi:hypothetical protein